MKLKPSNEPCGECGRTDVKSEIVEISGYIGQHSVQVYVLHGLIMLTVYEDGNDAGTAIKREDAVKLRDALAAAIEFSDAFNAQNAN